jgi:4-hydroxy-tetrahydrodipicolinate reductase
MKIALLGYGKMGKMIDELIQRGGRHEVILKADEFNRNTLSADDLKQADVAIDFSVPAAVMTNATLCLNAGLPLVIGTTGWYEQLGELKELCTKKNGAIIYASNFSMGVNIFFEVNRRLSELMKDRNDYEPRITEIHHTQKKDAPSGTAITLAKDILKYSSQKRCWSNEENGKQDELIILSRREGDVKGIHEVKFTSVADEITIRHEAFSREGFARGAIYAAEWISGKKGFFEFRELLLP